MRSEVLYQYDLPIELLDEIPRTEEVLEVIYARSKERYLIPILVTRERILWAYPETSVVYRVYAMQYVDLVSVYVRLLSPPLPSVIQFSTVNKQRYTFSSLQADKQQVRALLMTLADEMHQMAGKDWLISQKKTLLNEEYWADEAMHRGAEIISSGGGIAAASAAAAKTSAATDADFFEENPLPGKGCFESNEVLFSHFATEGEDVFEEESPAEKDTAKDPYAAADEKVARIVETVETEIAEARREAGVENADLKMDKDDSVIYGPKDAGVTDEQWGENSGGDAMILENPKRQVKSRAKDTEKIPEYGPEDDDSVLYPPVSAGAAVQNSVASKVREYGPEDDDSVLYPAVSAGAAVQSSAAPKVWEYGPEDDDSIVYPSPSDEQVVITPMKKPAAPIIEYTLIDESKPKPVVKPERDEVVLTPMKRPKPEFESVDGNGEVPVNFRQRPSDEKLTDNYAVAIGLSPKPSYEVGDEAIPLPVKPLPSYEFDEQTPPAAARKMTSFEENNKENIVLRNQAPDTPKRVFTSPYSEDQPSGMMNPFMKAVTLEPKDEYDMESIEKVLEELKHLRDTGIITPEEYKVRSLKLFKGE